MLEAKLVVVGGDAKSSEVRLKLPTVIGRGKEAGLTVPHALVSRRHTEIVEREGKLYVRDLGSLNGTFVNNLKIEGEQLLGPNQLLTLGNITFRAVYEVAADDLDATANSETVSFDEVKTQESPKKSPKKPSRESAPKIEIKKAAGKSVAPAIDFNETVPVDELKVASAGAVETEKPAVTKAAQKSEKIGSKPVKEVVTGAKVKPAAKSALKNDEQVEEKSDSKVELDEPEKETSAADTDKSFKSGGDSAEQEESISSIFSFDEENQNDGESVAVSSLGDLPAAIQPAASFVGNVDLGDDAKPVASQVEPIEIDLGVEKKPADDDDDAGLGSFLSKLPR